MRKILEILKLHFEGKQSGRAIARSASLALATVQECRKRFDAAGLTWPTDLDEAALTARMYPPSVAGPSRALPDFGAVQSQLVSHKAMTRRHLWAAYRAENPDGLGYSAFCDQLSRTKVSSVLPARDWAEKVGLTGEELCQVAANFRLRSSKPPSPVAFFLSDDLFPAIRATALGTALRAVV